MPSHNNSPTLVTYDCLHYAILDNVLPCDFEYTFDTCSKTAQRDILENHVHSHLALPGCCPNCEDLGCSEVHFRWQAKADVTEMQDMVRFSWQRFLESGRETNSKDLGIRARHLKKNPYFYKVFDASPEDPIFEPWKQMITNLTEAAQLLRFKELDIKRIAHLINASRWNTTRINRLLTDILNGMMELANEGYMTKHRSRHEVHYHRNVETGEQWGCDSERDRENLQLLKGVIRNRKGLEWEIRMYRVIYDFTVAEKKRVSEEQSMMSNVTGLEEKMEMLSIS